MESHRRRKFQRAAVQTEALALDARLRALAAGGSDMPSQKLRDLLNGTMDENLIQERIQAGWRVVAVEWERDSESADAPSQFVEPPFGFRIAGDCQHLEEHPAEAEVLRAVLQGIVNDRPLSFIADELNLRGYRTRSGAQWNPVNVFGLMPTLVDNSPRIFSEPEWPARRRQAV